MDLNIENKVAVITGSDSGIGLATAKNFVKEKAKVVLTDLDDGELKKAAEELYILGASKENVLTVKADLTNVSDVELLASEVKKVFGGADILVNCAGIRGAAGDFLNLSDDDWMKTVQVDLMIPVRVCRAFIPQMLEKEWGRIVLTASENALQPYEEESPYNACKAGVVNLGKCLSRQYSPKGKGILINCVSPAYIESPMTDTMMEKLAKEKGTNKQGAIDWFLENKRPFIATDRRGKPEEVANVIAFLCSEAASYVNGSNYRVDGGSVETAFG